LKFLAILLYLMICGCVRHKGITNQDLSLQIYNKLQTSLNIQSMERSWQKFMNSLDSEKSKKGEK